MATSQYISQKLPAVPVTNMSPTRSVAVSAAAIPQRTTLLAVLLAKPSRWSSDVPLNLWSAAWMVSRPKTKGERDVKRGEPVEETGLVGGGKVVESVGQQAEINDGGREQERQPDFRHVQLVPCEES